MRALLPGVATGEVLVLTEPLSMWGGLDPATGEVIDRRHPLLSPSRYWSRSPHTGQRPRPWP